MVPPRHCTGALLAGGRSVRFGGSPKGLETVGGERIVDRARAALVEASDALLLVANDGNAAAWLPGVKVARDVRAGAGALSGLHAALSAAPGDVLVLAWDAPFVPAALLRALRDAGELSDADAAVPRSSSPWGFEPLCAWYAPACVPAIERHLEASDHRAGGWQHHVRTLHVDVSGWGDPAVLFLNVNTREDLMRAERLFAQRDVP